MKKFLNVTLIVICLPFNLFAQNSWYAYTSKEMGFKVSFPQEPTSSSQTINSDAGPIKLNMVMLDESADTAASNLLYMTNFTVYPDSFIDWKDTAKQTVFFNGAVNGMVNNVKGKLISVKKIRLQDAPGREAKIDYQGHAVITARCVLVQNKVYIYMVFSAANKDNNADVTKFLDSFDLE